MDCCGIEIPFTSWSTKVTGKRMDCMSQEILTATEVATVRAGISSGGVARVAAAVKGWCGVHDDDDDENEVDENDGAAVHVLALPDASKAGVAPSVTAGSAVCTFELLDASAPPGPGSASSVGSVRGGLGGGAGGALGCSARPDVLS